MNLEHQDSISNANPFPEGTQIRLRNDPSRVGACTGRSRVQGSMLMIQVRMDGLTWYPDYELELLDEPPPEDSEALRTGRFGRSADLRRRLTHIQLSGGLADVVYSMHTTNTDFYAHQYKPVLSFLDSPSRGILIADEVGLGKTIEAGLIWTELRARIDARRLLVICPKMLCDKWRMELRNRFGVDARIVDTAELATELSQPSVEFPASQALIASIQGVRPPVGWEDDVEQVTDKHRLAKLLKDASGREPLLDLVIIDEAHYMRNSSTASHQLGRLLREVTDNIVLLSATPINLKSDDLFSLLSLVDPNSFRFREQFEEVLEANEPLVKARLTALAQEYDPDAVLALINSARQYPVLASSKQLETLASELNSRIGRPWDISERVQIADRIERVNSLSRVLTRTRKIDVTERKAVRHSVVHSIAMSEAESDFYVLVTDAIRDYAELKNVSDGFLLATPQRQLSSCMYAAASAWNAQDENDDDEELLYEDLGVETNRKPLTLFRQFLLDKIRNRYDINALRSTDSKFKCLSRLLRDFFHHFPNEKIVLFSYFRGTLHYLEWRLREIGIQGLVLTGGMQEDKSEMIERFRNEPDIRILLSSEVASEGVDLQFCRLLVNYDLPWNPMKVEQRIGRIDRLGQTAERIDILNLVYAGTIDSRIVQRLYERLKLFERALGSLEAVLGEEIQQLTADLLTGRLTPEEEEARISRTALALERCSQEERALEEQAGQLIAHSDHILKRVHAAKDFSRHISDDDLLLYVRDYLNRYAQGHRWFQPADDHFEIELTLPPATLAKFESFISEKRLHGLTRLAEGGIRQCRFANNVRTRSGGAEVISQFHPFVRFISEELQNNRAESIDLISVAVSGIAKGGERLRPGQFAFSVQRWTFNGLRTEEAIRARVVDINSLEVFSPDESLGIVNSARMFGADWPEATAALDHQRAASALEECELELVADFGNEMTQKNAENADRVQFQRQSIKAYLDRKLATERQRIENLGHEPRSRGLVRAAEKTIERLQERFGIQEAKLTATLQIDSRRETVGRGVINVEGEAFS